MSKYENPPFGRGETYYNGETIDSSDLGGLQHEGQEWWFEDINWNARGHKTKRSDKMVRCRLVRNTSGGALLPGFAGIFEKDGLEFGGRVDGMCHLDAQHTYLIDEFLPAAGVPNNDLFWLVMEGPAMAKTPMSGAGFNGDIAVGGIVVALTAATSGATTAGRVANQNITGSTQTADYSSIMDQVQNRIGRALSAKTTGNTNSDILIDVGKW